MEKLEYYYINRGTCAIVPIENDMSEVVELDTSFIVKKTPIEIIDESCRYFGSSYKGRNEGSKMLLKMNYKLPILIEEFNNLIFFPTSSPRFGNCIWISLNNIKSYEKVESNSKVIFNSGKDLFVKSSYYSLENQIFRASMLDSIIRRRRNI